MQNSWWGRNGAKTILYFELITTGGIILGITLANVFQRRSGCIDMSQLATVDISKIPEHHGGKYKVMRMG